MNKLKKRDLVEKILHLVLGLIFGLLMIPVSSILDLFNKTMGTGLTVLLFAGFIGLVVLASWCISWLVDCYVSH